MLVVRKLDDFLNRITMYRLLVYGLRTLFVIGVVFAFTGVLPFSGVSLLSSALILISVCFMVNWLLARLYGAVYNSESYLITALILTCILPPPKTLEGAVGIAIAGLIAMVSKYILSIRHKHIFNPAALAAFAVGLIGFRHASWWIGAPSMVIFTVLLGILVVRKIRRFQMVLIFTAAAVLMTALVASLQDQSLGQVYRNTFLSGPIIFMATIMLTEPLTAPATQYYRSLYGLLVGVVFASQLRFGTISFSPELSLLIGNLFAYVVNPKYKLTLRLQRRRELTPQVYEFTFNKPKGFKFKAGQYMEWTLPGLPYTKTDFRGNRRSFTIASSPTESELRLGIKFYEPSSAFKRKLRSMLPGDAISAGQLAGDFTLPETSNQNLVFIAGGVGITPFRSMLRYLVDRKRTNNVTVFYLVGSRAEAAYREELDALANDHIHITYVLSEHGPLTVKDITAQVPEYKNALFYISGPNAMVGAYAHLLRSIKIPSSHVKKDYFAGY